MTEELVLGPHRLFAQTPMRGYIFCPSHYDLSDLVKRGVSYRFSDDLESVGPQAPGL